MAINTPSLFHLISTSLVMRRTGSQRDVHSSFICCCSEESCTHQHPAAILVCGETFSHQPETEGWQFRTISEPRQCLQDHTHVHTCIPIHKLTQYEMYELPAMFGQQPEQALKAAISTKNLPPFPIWAAAIKKERFGGHM